MKFAPYIGIAVVLTLIAVISYLDHNSYLDQIYILDESTEAIPHTKSTNYIFAGGKLITMTPLTEEQLKIQEEKGCVACHEK